MGSRKIVRTQEEEDDHDLLILLNQKVDTLAGSVDKMNDGIRTRIRAVELKVEAHDTIIDKVDPISTYKRFEKVERKVGYLVFSLYLLSALGGVILWLTGVIGNIISIVKKL